MPAFYAAKDGALDELEVRANLHKAWDSLSLVGIQWNWKAYALDLENAWLKGNDEKRLAAAAAMIS